MQFFYDIQTDSAFDLTTLAGYTAIYTNVFVIINVILYPPMMIPSQSDEKLAELASTLPITFTTDQVSLSE